MTESPTPRLHWSPRVPPHKIRQLYESDARGLLDEELLDDIGHALYARCVDLVEWADAADHGRVTCRECGNMIARRGIKVGRVGDEAEVLKCKRCGWRITWGDYLKQSTGKNMYGTGAAPLFAAFVQRWPAARSAREKMLLIDRLIHQFHLYHRTLGHPVGINVLDASTDEVIELLDSLAYGTASASGLLDTQQTWRAAREIGYINKPQLQAMARELGIAGYRVMQKDELVAAIERADAKRFDQWQKVVQKLTHGLR